MGKVIAHLRDLAPDPKNARRHNARNVGMIEAALNEVGAARSIVIDEDGVVLAGNATIEAAAQAGIERVQVVEADGETIIAVQRKGLTAEQKTKLALFDNRAAELAEWDAGVLAGLAEEVDLSGLFRDDELSALLADVGQPEIGGGGDEFDTTPPEGPTRTALGDLWSISGNGLTHRLIVGDCTDPLVVERLMGGERADAVVTDPPYGVRYRQGDEKRHWHAAKKRFVDVPIHGDDRPFDPSHLVEAAPLVVLWGANNYADKLPPSRGWLVWDKKPDITSNDFADAELAWTNRDAVVRAFRHRWSGVIRDSQNGDEHYHATEKPIALFLWCFDVCGAGGLIYDPYLGSGTSIIATHQTGRRCFGCEIEPKWADTCLRRAEAAGLTCERIQSDA